MVASPPARRVSGTSPEADRQGAAPSGSPTRGSVKSRSRSLGRGFQVSSTMLSTPRNGRRSSLELMDLVASPPDWVVEGLGKALRERLGLELFNIDLIYPRQRLGPGGLPQPATYYVVDINYFPGYDGATGS